MICNKTSLRSAKKSIKMSTLLKKIFNKNKNCGHCRKKCDIWKLIKSILMLGKIIQPWFILFEICKVNNLKTDFSDLLWCIKSWNGAKFNGYFIVRYLWFIDLSSNWINRYEETEEQKAEDAFREVITSCRSLSTYEPNNIKSAVPQVISLNW